MTMTINVPVFPMRDAVRARKESRGLGFLAMAFASDATRAKRRRYSPEAFEFDFSEAPRSAGKKDGRKGD